MNICLICLRTDKVIKGASEALKDFHEDLCDVPLVGVTYSGQYCSECVHMLTEFYKFKEQCQLAQKIYHKWLSAKTSCGFQKYHKNALHTLLSPSSLDTSQSETQTDQSTGTESTKTTRDVKTECDQNCNNDSTIEDILRNENISVNVKLERLDHDTETEDRMTCRDIGDIVDRLSESTSDNDDNFLSNIRISELKSLAKETQTHKTTRRRAKKNDQETLVRKKSEQKSKSDRKKNSGSTKALTAKKKAYFDRFKENDKMYESMFEIEYLNTLEMKLEEFQRRKTYEHYVKAEHKCEICYQVVKSSKFLEYHMNRWHNESKDSMLCPICNTWNSRKSKHRRAHIVVFRCKLCPLVTYHRKSMQNHFEQHRGKQYHCDTCNVSYKSNSSYLNHMGKLHRRGRNVCEACGRGFSTPLGLKIHKNNSFRCTVGKEGGSLVEAVEGVRCDDCDVTLPSQEVYDAHISDVHEPKRKSRALQNPDAPLSRIHSQRSRKRIRRTPEHKCRLCSKVGVSFGWLQVHFRKEHPNHDLELLYMDMRNHLCDVCGSGFSNVYALRAHINIHTGARPHACDLCPKKFRSAYLMREHRLRHFPSALPCTHCGKTFKTRANLYTHMKTHTGERDHVCDICGKGFVQRVNLREHIRGVHYNIRRVKRKGEGDGRTQKRRKISPEPGVDVFDESC